MNPLHLVDFKITAKTTKGVMHAALLESAAQWAFRTGVFEAWKAALDRAYPKDDWDQPAYTPEQYGVKTIIVYY